MCIEVGLVIKGNISATTIGPFAELGMRLCSRGSKVTKTTLVTSLTLGIRQRRQVVPQPLVFPMACTALNTLLIDGG